MKKIKELFLLLLLLPLNVKAASLDFSCPTMAIPNSNIECVVTTTDQLKGIKFNLSLPSPITTNELETNWTNHYKGENGIVATNNNNENFTTSMRLKITNQATIGQTYQIGLINIEASDNEHKLVNIDNINKTIKVVSDDSTLSSLTITGGSLSPKFSKNTSDYTATVNSDKTTITATPTQRASKVEGNIGEVKLNYGVNRIIITVTSEYGTTKTYTISITRPLPTTKPTTDKNTITNKSNNYNGNKNNSSNKSKKQQDNNEIVIDKSSDASLKSIEIKGYEIDFKPNIFSYSLEIPNEVSNIEVIATPNNDKAKVEINNPEILEVGENIITITITAEDGTICKYEIEVTREKEEEEDTTPNNTKTIGEKTKSNKEISIFPSIPLTIIILIILLILLILFIILKRIFKKDN